MDDNEFSFIKNLIGDTHDEEAPAPVQGLPRVCDWNKADGRGDSHGGRREHKGDKPPHDGVKAYAGAVFCRRGA